MVRYISFSLVLGQVTQERFAAVKVPPALRPNVSALDEIFVALKQASARADQARIAKGLVSSEARSAHQTLSESVQALALAVTHADPTVRLEPFATFGTSPTKVLKRTRAGAARAAEELAKRVLASSPKKPVKQAAEHCAKAAQRVLLAHSKLTPVSAHYKGALSERDALQADFAQQYESVKRLAKHVWRKTPADFDKVFAPVERYQLNSKHAKSKAVQAPATPTDPATPPKPTATPPATVTPPPTTATPPPKPATSSPLN